MANQVMRITLKAYDHQLVDSCAARIVDTVKKTGAAVSGPVPLPTRRKWLLSLELYISTKTLVSSSSREHTRD